MFLNFKAKTFPSISPIGGSEAGDSQCRSRKNRCRRLIWSIFRHIFDIFKAGFYAI